MIRLFVRAMFIIVPILMVAMLIWNLFMFQQCRADGHKAYQCQAMLSNPSYVVVDDMRSGN